MSIAIGLIVMVAALQIVASLILLVMEKSRDIGILKTMGTSPQRISVIFMMQGLIIGIVGTASAPSSRSALCWVLTEYQLVQHPEGRLPGRLRAVHRQAEDFVDGGRVGDRHLLPGDDLPVAPGGRLDPVQALRFE